MPSARPGLPCLLHNAPSIYGALATATWTKNAVTGNFMLKSPNHTFSISVLKSPKWFVNATQCPSSRPVQLCIARNPCRYLMGEMISGKGGPKAAPHALPQFPAQRRLYFQPGRP